MEYVLLLDPLHTYRIGYENYPTSLPVVLFSATIHLKKGWSVPKPSVSRTEKRLINYIAYPYDDVIYTTDLKRKQLAYLYDQSLDHLTFFRNLQVPIKKFLVWICFNLFIILQLKYYNVHTWISRLILTQSSLTAGRII